MYSRYNLGIKFPYFRQFLFDKHVLILNINYVNVFIKLILNDNNSNNSTSFIGFSHSLQNYVNQTKEKYFFF